MSTNNNTSSQQRIRPLQALRAVRKVVDDPEQTTQVFRVIQALSGPSLRRNFKRFKATTVGKRVLSEKLDLVAMLNDREMLSNLPEHSLGHAYFRFVTKEQISADGLAQANDEAGYIARNPDLDRFVRRIRSSHDLFHVLTQYGRDPLGEACLLAFTYGQTGNIAFPFILTAGAWRLYLGAGLEVFRALWRGYRDGRNASWLLEADWEELLKQPLVQVRQQLNINPPERYQNLTAKLAQA